MACWLKQSTAVDIAMGPFVDNADGNTVEGSLTITQPDIRLKKNGGNWAQKSAAQTLSHEEAGWYEVNLSTTDTDTLGILVVAIHESGALPVWREFMVVAANVYDSLIGGGDVLDVSTTQFNGSSVVQSGGRPEVNTTHIAGSSVSTSSAQIGVNVVNAGGTAWGSGAITAAAIATGAIDADAIADNAIDAGAIADGAITAAKIATGAIDADALAADAVDEIWDEVLEGSYSARQLMRLYAAALGGKATGLDTGNPVYRNTDDDVDVIDATTDEFGNRSAVTLDLSDTP